MVGRANHFATTFVLAAAALIFVVLPIYYMFLIANGGADRSLSSLVPDGFQLPSNLAELFANADFTRYFVNSTIMAGGIAFLDVVFSGLAGYALAKLRFPGSTLLFGVVVGTLALSPIVVIIPVYVMMRNLGWLNTYQGLIIPLMISAFGVFLVRQFALDIPDALLNAARIEGASEWRVYFQIAMPLLRQALLTLFLLQFTAQWDNLLWPLVAADRPDHWTVAVGLAAYQQQLFRVGYPLIMAGAIVSMLPPLIVFVLLQRYYVRGLTLGGLKG